MIPDLLKPNWFYPQFSDIDFYLLAREGIEYLIVDVDNTITLRNSWEIEFAPRAAFSSAKEAGIKDICLLSNIVFRKEWLIFGQDREARIAYLAGQIKAKYLCLTWPQLKPNPEVFRQAMKQMGSRYSNTAVIGDQIFTDVLGGNRAGCCTVLVRPIAHHCWLTNFFRGREEKRILKKLGLSGGSF